jgi:hypothetical protein
MVARLTPGAGRAMPAPAGLRTLCPLQAAGCRLLDARYLLCATAGPISRLDMPG